MSRRPTGYSRASLGTSETIVGRRCGSRAVETTPAGLLTAYTIRPLLDGDGRAVERDPVAGADVVRRIGHDRAADGHPPGAHDLLGRAPRGDATVGEVLREPHRLPP